MCATPMQIRNKFTGELHLVPCSKCPECVGRRVSAWSFRLMLTELFCKRSYFVTLTYDNEHVPKSEKKFLTLCKRDVQLFFKRLRKRVAVRDPEVKVRYYAVGEYGSNNWRPHYHLILFNADKLSIEEAWRDEKGAIGGIDIGSVTGASVGYTLKYISKPKRVPYHVNDDRIPEFALMSKGLGHEYLTPAMIAWHKADLLNRMYVNTYDGKKVSMPRYYKDKIYTKGERIGDRVDEDGNLHLGDYVPGERDFIAAYFKANAEQRYEEFWNEQYKRFGEYAAQNKAALDKHAFEKMHKDSHKNRYL